MTDVSRKIAKGAAWMVGLRLLQRGLGIISTVVLARLLVPEDFGLVAMALSFYALIELFSMVGLDLAIIRQQNVQRMHFDTAWTLGIALKSIIAVVLVVGAPYVADFYNDPRLRDLVYVLAVVAFTGAFENIGVVAFRKELEFHQEFKFHLAKKILSVAATVALALHFRSYWALVLGMLASTLFGVALSYLIHPFRPRFSVAAWRDMIGFSTAIAFNGAVGFLRDRGPDFIIGRFASAGPLGAYRVATEIASLPTSQLYFPIMRAVLPGYSKVVGDVDRLKATYLSTQAALATMVLPVAVGMALVAEPFVQVLLGEKWLVAVPLLQILSLSGATRVLHGNRHALFTAKGKPQWVGLIALLEVLILLPLITFGMWKGYAIEFAAWARIIASLAVLPLSTSMVMRVLAMRRIEFAGVMWRPMLGCVVMSGTVLAMRHYLDPMFPAVPPLVELLVFSVLGAVTYVFALFAMWLVSGRRDGFELSALKVLHEKGKLPAFVARRLLHGIGPAPQAVP